MVLLKGALVLAVVATAFGAVAGQTVITPLQPFNLIHICLPFNVVIGQSEGTNYQMIVEADPGVAAAVNASITDNVLVLGLADNVPPATLAFRAPNPIKVAVQLPADQLSGIAVSSVPSIVVAVAPGFTSPEFTASLSGTSTLSVQNLRADSVETFNSGTGTLYLGGEINTATAVGSGTGNTYLIGIARSAAVQAAGISKVFVSGTEATQIVGQVSGISSVYFDQGICTVSSEFGGIFGSPCTQQAIAPPRPLTTPQWSCALTVYGTFGCSEGGSGSSGSTSSSSSTGGGSGQTVSSTTVNGVTTTITGTSNPDGTSSLVTNSGTLQIGACPLTGVALNIFPAA